MISSTALVAAEITRRGLCTQAIDREIPGRANRRA
jgi:hypothetical protein